MQQLLQELFVTAGQQQAPLDPAWVKSGCNLLLRALTRSPQFVADPELPLLPEAALATLAWLKAHTLEGAGAMAAAATTSAAPGRRSSAGGSGSTAVAAGAPALVQGVRSPQGQLLLRDDKVYLLLTKLILTATGAPAAVAAAVANAADVAEGQSFTPPSAAPAAEKSDGGTERSVNRSSGQRGVQWAAGTPPDSADGTAAAAAGHGPGTASIRDPALLCQLLEWSSSKVRLAMQQLLELSEPTGA